MGNGVEVNFVDGFLRIWDGEEILGLELDSFCVCDREFMLGPL